MRRGGCIDWQEGKFMDVPITDALLSKNRAYDGAPFSYSRRPSLLTQIVVTAAMAIVTILAPAAGARARGDNTGGPPHPAPASPSRAGSPRPRVRTREV